jgi:tetratricopeptide (TPR) repeat protein
MQGREQVGLTPPNQPRQASLFSDPAVSPGGKSTPSVKVLLGLAVGVVVILGIIWVAFRDGAGAYPERQTRLKADRALAQARHDEALEYALETLRELEERDLPETIRQMIDRLNQWMESQKPLEGWRIDPLVETLSEPYRKLVDELRLEQMKFEQEDASFFREVVWLRNIAEWAHKGAVDPLSQAEAIFDWVVRNIQLEAPPVIVPGSQMVRVLPWPWETLLFGRGTATDRAWVCVLLLRQLGIDAGIVGLVRRESLGGERIDLWAVGVPIEGELYLFEPTLGIPVPSPTSPFLDSQGRLVVRPATLREAAADDSLLRKLDLPEQRYPVRAEELQQVVVFVDGSPHYLSQRMFLLQGRVAGRLSIVLTASPSQSAKRFAGLEHVREVRLLPTPYQVIENSRVLGQGRTLWLLQQLRPFMVGREYGSPLWKGRQYHFRGIFEGDVTANTYYQEARAPERQIREQQLEPDMAALLRQVKLYASYWLGLIAAEQGNAVSAEDYFLERTLKAFGGGPFLAGALYNLGRVYESEGQIAKAIQMYLADPNSACAWGNAVRAKWLKALHHLDEQREEDSQGAVLMKASSEGKEAVGQERVTSQEEALGSTPAVEHPETGTISEDPPNSEPASGGWDSEK